MPRTPPPSAQQRTAGNDDGTQVLVTGGAGFIGANLSARLASLGHRVIVLDNLSRDRVDENLAWLRREHGERVVFEHGDVRDRATVRRVVGEAQAVFHLAAQVAVTQSLDDPRFDFEVNALGTLNVLEALRARPRPPPLLYASTNKVYGALEDLALASDGERYAPTSREVARHGIGEERPLDFQSPYGCSKGAADQYVREYARSFAVPAVVFRMSCIYGPHQFGSEDQGWVAHFALQALADAPVTIYGDGAQVRDVLYIDDLVDAMLLAWKDARQLAGRAFNVGGGPDNTTSLKELVARLEALGGRPVSVLPAPWRLADQRYYVSNMTGLREATGWSPRVGVERGVTELYRWLEAQATPTRAAAPTARKAAP